MELNLFIDWSIVIVVLGLLTWAALHAGKYTTSVSGFLVADRCAGRFLLAVAEGEAAWGAITILYYMQNFSKTGWSISYWNALSVPIAMFLAITGWILYRFRETRAMTLAQFFEIRYSKKFRVFAGILSFLAGVIGFGIFPAVAGRFFICWFEFENIHYHIGGLDINLTLALVMAVLVGLALFFTFVGGQIAVIVTDFWQGIFATAVFIIVVGLIIFTVGWDKISDSLVAVSEPGKSLYDPFDISEKPDFGWSFFLIGWFFALYNRLSMGGTQQYKCSALTAHEGKMAAIFGNWRTMLIVMGFTMIPCASMVLMNSPEYSHKAAMVTDYLQKAFPDNAQYRDQMLVPTALKHMLPVGLTGCFAVAMLGFFISTNNSMMHSYGSIFVQDVVCPLRKKAFTQKAHMRILRISICGVAFFAFTFSLLFKQTDYIYMFLQITAAVAGGLGAVVIGGLYWKRGTTLAAWVAMILPAILSISSIILTQFWSNFPTLVERWGDKFPINGQRVSFLCAVLALLSYFVVSALQWGKVINMDKLLHRGKYAIKEDEDEVSKQRGNVKPIGRFWRFIGVNSREFSKQDRIVFLLLWSYNIYVLLRFLVILILWWAGIFRGETWLKYWHYFVFEYFTIAVVFAVWITIGGLFDLKKMFRTLASRLKNIDVTDDGRVKEEEHLADDQEQEKES